MCSIKVFVTDILFINCRNNGRGFVMLTENMIPSEVQPYTVARAGGGSADHHPHSVLTLKQSAAETDTT